MLMKETQSMTKVFKSTFAMMSSMKLKTEHNQIILGEYYKKPKKWQKIKR
mgnify:FL=1